MTECEFCKQEVEDPSHAVVNGRIFTHDQSTCAECGMSDEELIEWVEENQPQNFDLVKDSLEEDR